MLRETVRIVAQTGDETTGIGIVASLHLDTLVQTEYINQLDGDSDVGGGSLHLGSSSPAGIERAVVECLYHRRLSRRP